MNEACTRVVAEAFVRFAGVTTPAGRNPCGSVSFCLQIGIKIISPISLGKVKRKGKLGQPLIFLPVTSIGKVCCTIRPSGRTELSHGSFKRGCKTKQTTVTPPEQKVLHPAGLWRQAHKSLGDWLTGRPGLYTNALIIFFMEQG